MHSPLLSTERVAVIAHRGGSKLWPENTLDAFAGAVGLGVDGLECDVHLSSDGEVMVIHDATLDRTTNATGPVAARRASELARVDAGFHFGASAGFPHRAQGAGVPMLSELLDRFPAVPVIIEMKGEHLDLASRTVDVVRQARAEGRVILAGFSDLMLTEVRRLAPDVPTSASTREVRSALTRSHFRLGPKSPAFQVFQVPLRLKGREVLRRGFVRAARRAGIPVQAWIIDDPSDMSRLVQWGVTGIITDRPDAALAALRPRETAGA